MFEAWREELNGPQGEQIRRQLEKNYFIIAHPWRDFVCRWHRMEQLGHTDPEQPPAINYGRQINPLEEDRAWERDKAMGVLPCENTHSSWPEGLDARSLIRQELPLHALPDGRRVFFVPKWKSYGTVGPLLWRELVSGAKEARGPLLAHAYDVAMGVLQFWKKIAPRIVERRAKRKELIDAGESTWEFDGQVDPSGRDQQIESWVFFWARHLHENPMEKFTASNEALGTLAKAYGYTASSIESIIRRESKRRVRQRQRATRK